MYALSDQQKTFLTEDFLRHVLVNVCQDDTKMLYLLVVHIEF